MFRLLCNELGNCSASYVCVTGITHLQNVVQEKCVCFMTCIAQSGNAVLQSIMNSDALYTSLLCHHWRNMLYIYSF